MDVVSSNVDLPLTDIESVPEKIDEAKLRDSSIRCDLCDTEIVHKIAQVILQGLATASVDNTSGGIFRAPGSVAADLRKEMLDYLTQRSETCVAESIILESPPDTEVSDHPYDIISDFVDDFASSKRNFFSRVSGWLLSEKREDKIDDFVQDMDINGFWPIERREVIAQALLKNVDFKNEFHCDMKFSSLDELAAHFGNCSFRSLNCRNEGCTARFCASHAEKHDSSCPFKIIPCEQKCPANLMRRDMDRHCITVCPMKLVNCPFYTVGCQSPVPLCMMEQHSSDNLHSHILHILHSIHKEASIEDLKQRLQQLEKAPSFDRLTGTHTPRALTMAVKAMDAELGPLEVSCKNEEIEETKEPSTLNNEAVKDVDAEKGPLEVNLKNEDIEESKEPSNLVNAPDEAVKDIGDEKGPLEVNLKNEDIEESKEPSNLINATDEAVKDMGAEKGPLEVNLKNEDIEESKEPSNLINATDEAVKDMGAEKGPLEVNLKNEDIEESKEPSNLINATDEAVKDMGAEKGPLEVNLKNADIEETKKPSNLINAPDEAVKNMDAEKGPLEVHLKNEDIEETKKHSNLINAPDEAVKSMDAEKGPLEVNLKNEDIEETKKPSNLVIAPDEAER